MPTLYRLLDMCRRKALGNVPLNRIFCESAAVVVADLPDVEVSNKGSREPNAGRRFRQIVSGVLAAIATIALFPSAAKAQTAFGSQTVGNSSTLPVTVVASSAGTVASVEVLTYGASSLDYSDKGGTCAGMNFAAPGQSCTEQVAFDPLFPGLRLGVVLLLDGSNNTLGIAYLSGTGLGGLAVFTPGNEITVAGTGGWVFGGDGGPANQAQLDLPTSVAIDGAGNLYIADSQHHRIRMVSSGKGATIQGSVTYPQAGYITTIAGIGYAGFTGNNVSASSSTVTLNNPSGLALDSAGNLFIADTGNHAIREIVAATGIIQTIAGTGTAGSSGDNGPATSALLNAPAGVTADSQGNLYIGDTGNHKIRAICAGTSILYNVTCPGSGTIVTLAGTGFTNTDGSGGFSGDNGAAISAKLNGPYAVTFDASGNMYIPDSNNNRVRMVNPAGIITTVAGSGNPGYSGDGGSATAASIRMPSAVLFDAAQNLLIADTENSAIRKVNLATGIISTYLGGASGSSTANGTIYRDNLYGPRGIALDPYGDLYIADYYNMRVREVQSNTAILDLTKNVTQLGETSAGASYSIENDGNAQLTLSSISPDANSILVNSGTTCATAPMAVDTQCSIEAEFAPTVAGNPLFSNITITGATDNSPLTLIIAGNAPPANSTTINVSSSQNPAYFGQSITFTATVSSGAGTGALSGTLAFYDGSTKLADNIAINSIGNGQFTTSTLAIGTHSITIQYSGDSKHYASTSSPISQVVNEQTAVVLTSSLSPVPLGSSVTLTATVSIAGNGGNVVPDGQVAFLDGSTLLNTVNISQAGVAKLTVSQLSQGAHTLTAVYGGDAAKFVSGSTSPAVTLNVVAGTTLGLTSGPNPTTYGAPVTFTTALTSTGAGTPTGQITVMDGSTPIGTITLPATTFATSSLAVGSHTITATYPGDANFASSTSSAVTQVVNALQTTTVLTATPAAPVAGVTVTLNAAVTGSTSGATITGKMTFVDGSTQLGTATLDSTGHASITTTFAAGTHTITASYSGDANDKVSTSNTLTLVVNLATTQVALASSGTPADVLASIAFQATVTSNGLAPTGTVVFAVDGTNVNTAPLNPSGIATFSDSNLGVGTHTITATYSGDTVNSTSSGTFSQVVVAIPTTTFLTTAAVGGNSIESILIATTSGASGPTPTGTITFMNGSTSIGTATLDSGGVATFVPQLPAGDYNITAQYGGDTIHAASASGAVSIKGTAAGFSVAAKPSSLQMVAGQSGSIAIEYSSINGFTDSLVLGCLGLPANVTCRFSRDQFVLKAGGTSNVTVLVDTAGSIVAKSNANEPRFDSTPRLLAGLGLPAVFILGIVMWRARKSRLYTLIIAGALALVVMGGVGGCSSYAPSYVKPGTYTFQVGAVGSASKVAQYQTVTLTVTQK